MLFFYDSLKEGEGGKGIQNFILLLEKSSLKKRTNHLAK
jgi:hypothetical protein